MIRPTYVRASVGSRMSGSWFSATTSVFFCAWAVPAAASAASAPTATSATPLKIFRMVSSSGIRISPPGGGDGPNHTSRGRQAPQGLLAQLHLLDLPGAGHREILDEDDVARDLEARDPPLAVREHLGVGERRAGLAPHEGHAHFRQARVGEAHHSGQVDAAEAHQERLDLHRVDVLAADLEHVLVATHEAEVAILAHHAHVTRVQPAVAVERLRRLGGLAVVALHRHVAPHEDLAGHARRLIGARQGSTTRISYPGAGNPDASVHCSSVESSALSA